MGSPRTRAQRRVGTPPIGQGGPWQSRSRALRPVSVPCSPSRWQAHRAPPSPRQIRVRQDQPRVSPGMVAAMVRHGSRDRQRGRSDDAQHARDRSDREPRAQRKPPGGSRGSTSATAVPETVTQLPSPSSNRLPSSLPTFPTPLPLSLRPPRTARRHGPVPRAIGESTTEIVVPVVTFGNGRSPGPSPAQQPRVLPTRTSPAQPARP